MNDYSSRAEYYQFEFGTDEDFSTISRLLVENHGPMAEIPCGSGRLLPLYQSVARQVTMIDLEKKMVEKCEAKIKELGLTNRVRVVCGNMKDWQSEEPLQLVIMPRGGIQLLQSLEDVRETLTNLSRSIEPGGILYLDIARPWMATTNSHGLLPDFMQFLDSKNIKGNSVFQVSDEELLRRTFDATLYPDNIVVKLSFSLERGSSVEKSYSSDFRWIKIERDYLTMVLSKLGFTTIELYGDYLLSAYTSESARLLCIAQKST